MNTRPEPVTVGPPIPGVPLENQNGKGAMSGGTQRHAPHFLAAGKVYRVQGIPRRCGAGQTPGRQQNLRGSRRGCPPVGERPGAGRIRPAVSGG